MKELKPSGLISVPLPLESYNIQDTKADGIMWQMPDGSWDSFYFETGLYAPYEIIGWCTADEISFDPSPYVPVSIEIPSNLSMGRLCTALRNQKKEYEKHFRDNILTANGVLFVNPYGEKDPCLFIRGAFTPQERKRIKKDKIKWDLAESQLVKKVLILKTINK